LHGVYMYGAAVFPDSGPIGDIDCHVILEGPLSDKTRNGILQLENDLSERFPPLGEELDAYFILFNDAKQPGLPTHQLRPEKQDKAWALHCAHIRAGRYIGLYGPEPTKIFPTPSWDAISVALEYELRFIEENLQYPDYCILNLCRIMYSFQEREVVVSKFFCGEWARTRFPTWKPVIEVAIKSYNEKISSDEAKFLNKEVGPFLEFGSNFIREARI